MKRRYFRWEALFTWIDEKWIHQCRTNPSSSPLLPFRGRTKFSINFHSKFQIFLPKPRTRKQYTDKMRATRSSSDQGSTHRLVIISVGAGWCNIFRIAAWIPGSEMKCGSWWKFSQPNITGGAILKTVKAISWLQPNLLFELTGIQKKLWVFKWSFG